MANTPTPPSEAFLNKLAAHQHLRPNTWYLIATATSTALGHGKVWVPAVYAHAVKPLGPAPSSPSTPPADFQSDPLPRRKVVRRIKEALVKSVVITGVVQPIEVSFALMEALEPGDRDSSFVRAGLADSGKSLAAEGEAALLRIYRDCAPLVDDVAAAMMDIRWISLVSSYGALLSPIAETTPSAPLTLAETEIIVLSCLIVQRAVRELKWHFRGSLWNGITEKEIEAIQQAIEMVAVECGVDVRSGMPRVHNLTEDEKQGKSQI